MSPNLSHFIDLFSNGRGSFIVTHLAGFQCVVSEAIVAHSLTVDNKAQCF